MSSSRTRAPASVRVDRTPENESRAQVEPAVKYVGDTYEATDKKVKEKYAGAKVYTVETYASSKAYAGETYDSAYATALSYVLKIKAALGSRDKAPEPVTAEAVEEPVAV